MKGDANPITNILFIVAVLVLFFVLVNQIVPQMLIVFNTAALDSSDFVAKELSELVTISNAAPNQIFITYNPSTSKYNFDVQNRILETGLVKKTGETQSTALAKIADNVATSFQNVNVFYIRRSASGTSIGAN